MLVFCLFQHSKPIELWAGAVLDICPRVQWVFSMVDLEKFKKALGEAGKGLSEEEIKGIMELQDKIADALFDMWRKETKKKNGLEKVAIDPLADNIQI